MKHKFVSKLWEDVEWEKANAAKDQQMILDGHLKTHPITEKSILYSNDSFCQAAIEWLIATDQVCSWYYFFHTWTRSEHTQSQFKPLIIRNSRRWLTLLRVPLMVYKFPAAKQPEQKSWHSSKTSWPASRTIWMFVTFIPPFSVVAAAYITLYWQSPAVTGEIHLTCDAWQADNVDGYFAVTGHWIEESTPSVWEPKEALFGYTCLNNAHHGVCLGKALFKIVDRLGIAHQVRCSFHCKPFNIRLIYFCRSATSHVTMQKTMEQCSESLQDKLKRQPG